MPKIKMDPLAWIEYATDQDTFQEVNSQCKEIVSGFAKINNKRVAIYSHQPKVNQGFISSVGAQSILSIMELALEERIPLISFMCSPGVSVKEGIKSADAYTKVIAMNIKISGVIPQIALIMGTTMGAPAYSCTLMDFALFNKARSSLMVTGPGVIQKVMGRKTSIKKLGGAQVQSEVTGISDIIDSNIQEQIDSLKKLLEFIPPNSQSIVKITPSQEPRDKMILPSGPKQAYDIKNFINAIIDDSHLFELKKDFAKSLLTGFSKIGGINYALIANQSTSLGGAIDYKAARKAARFIRFCNNFNIPLLNLIDVPGFMPGEEQEHNGLLRYGAQMCQSMQTTTLRLSVVVRRCYGAAAFLMMQTKNQGGDYVMALEKSSIAIMGYAAAKTMLYDDNTDRSQDYYEQYESPKIALKLGIIDEVIKPAQVRQRVIELTHKFKNKKFEKPLGRKHLSLP